MYSMQSHSIGAIATLLGPDVSMHGNLFSFNSSYKEGGATLV